jgi:ribosomal protein L11 methylase PrmA
MLPQHLLPQLSAIATLVPKGVVILSGMLHRQDGEVSRQLQIAGFRITERCHDGDWIAYRTVREVQ